MRGTTGLLFLLLAVLPLSTRDVAAASSRSLTLDERVAAQRAIEEVYWRHRIWPAENSTPKPSFDSIMPTAALRAKVEDYLAKSNALESWWGHAITGDQLQAELDRFVLYDLGERVYTPKSEFAVPELSRPTQIQFDAKGNLLALDAKSRRLGRVGLDGAFLGFLAVESGGGPAAVITSFAIAPDGSISALDIAGGRVLVVTAEGKFVRQVLLPSDCRAPSGVAVDASGKIFVADAAGPRLYAAAKDQATMAPITGSLREDMDFAGALTVDAQGHVFVLDAHGGGIVIFGSDGSFRGRQAGFGWLDGQLRWPASICFGATGGLAVADRENNRIVTFLIAP